MALQDLLQKRAKLVADGRAILEKAEKEKRELNTEEREESRKLDEAFDAVDATIAEEEKQLKREKSLGETRSAITEKTSGSAEKATSGRKQATEAYERDFAHFLKTGEQRDGLVQGSNTQGGSLVASEVFVNKVLVKLDNLLFIRQKATKIQLSGGQSLGVPTMSTDISDADWTTEIGTSTVDTALAFGKRQMITNFLTKEVKVSRQLIANAAVSVVDFIAARLAFKFAAAEENNFLNGNGVNKPLGLLVADANGVSTNRDVLSGSSGAVAADGVWDVVGLVAQQYLSGNCGWVTSRVYRNAVRKLKTSGSGEYIFQPSLAAGAPSTLCGFPIVTSEYISSSLSSGAYPAIFGDFSNYWIADELDLEIQRLDELYARTNQIGFIGRKRLDGAPVDENAFARQKIT